MGPGGPDMIPNGFIFITFRYVVGNVIGLCCHSLVFSYVCVRALLSRMLTGGISRPILGREEPLTVGKINLEISQAFLPLAHVTKTGKSQRNQVKAMNIKLLFRTTGPDGEQH